MKTLAKIWNALNGNKTTIGMIIVLVSQGFKVFTPGLIPLEQLNFIESIGMSIGGVGLFHKGVKNDKMNKIINKSLRIRQGNSN